MLSRDRPQGMSVGPIPFQAIDAYARRAGLGSGDSVAFDLFAELIVAMDREFMEAVASDRS